MGLQVARSHLRGPDYREFTVSISLLMHPGSYAVSSPCAWLQTLALTSPHLQELAGPWGGGGGGGVKFVSRGLGQTEGRVKEKEARRRRG